MVQWLRLHAPSAGGLGSIPDRGTRSHMLQLKILHTSTKNGCSQINKSLFIETCIKSCMKRVASPGLMHDTGCLGLVHWDDPEGWYGEGGGFRMGNTCIPVVDSF